MKNRISIQYTVSRSMLSSISYRLAHIFCALSSRQPPAGRRRARGTLPPIRANVIKTRTPQWEWIWLSAALVAVLLAAGIGAGIYLDQHSRRAMDATPAASMQSAPSASIRNVSDRGVRRRTHAVSAPLRADTVGI